MRADIIGHLKSCVTDIYLYIDARTADYIHTHPYATKDGNSHEYCSRNSNIHEDAAGGIDRCGPAQRAAATALARSLSGFPPDEVATATEGVEGDAAGGGAEIWALLGAFGSADVCTDPCATPRVATGGTAGEESCVAARQRRQRLAAELSTLSINNLNHRQPQRPTGAFPYNP